MFGHRNHDDLQYLRSVDAFERLRGSELRRVAQLSTSCRFAAGMVLCREGSLPLEVFVILSGSVAADPTAGSGRILGPGDAVGELAVLTRSRRTMTLSALTEVEALVFNPREFNTVLADVPALAPILLGSVDRSGRGPARAALLSAATP